METTTVVDNKSLIPSILTSSVRVLPGVGKHMAELLAKLQITTIHELLLHLPYKYQDRTRITAIKDLQINTHAVIQAKAYEIKLGFSKNKKRILSVHVHDASGILELKFFQFNNIQLNQFKTNPILRCFGEIKYGPKGLVIIHPEYEVINEYFINPVEDNMRAIYPSTDGISQRKWQTLINSALEYFKANNQTVEYLPIEVMKHGKLINFSAAIEFIHCPPPDIQINILDGREHPAQQRLIFEELLAQQLAMQTLKKQQAQHQGWACDQRKLSKSLLELIPFKLTDAQQRVFGEISADLAKGSPMNRLLQGDVGSGKTVIAALSILQVVNSGYQVALMAPTEILAEQHYINLSKYFKILGVRSELLVAKLTKKNKKLVKNDLENNELAIVIGTHALIQDDVKFKKLGLIIIDEQHRFGVEQRHLLLQKSMYENYHAHQLTMTATPIPRTLAMTLYANMDYSVIDELPPGRKAVNTLVIDHKKRDAVIQRISSFCAQGRQVYWVCTLIEESEILTCQAAEDTCVYLQQQLPPLSVGLIHGRMKPDIKSQIMRDFKEHKIQILVATTVIEVGVDVPNASLMVIENPERLGLAQLHQLRGRVGRGEHESYCVLLYKSPLSATAEARLSVIRDNNDGFKLAEHDLRIRGAGELLGKKQTGVWNLKIADLIKDHALLNDTRKWAQYITDHYPESVEQYIKLWLGDNHKLGVV